MTVYDVLVIGAGPAGAAVSISLAQKGYQVLLLEKSHFPRPKLCGEFLAPECRPALDRLGVLNRIHEAGARPIVRWKLIALDGRNVEVPMSWISGNDSPALGLSRARLDQILLEQARESGVDAREGVLVAPRLRPEGNDFVIDASEAGKGGLEFRASLVIDASGRNSVFRAKATADRASARLFGCKIHMQELAGLEELGELFFFRNGYGGVSNVEDGRTNLCFLTTEATLREAKGDRERLLDLTLRSNPAGRVRLQGAEFSGSWLGTGPITYGRRPSTPGLLTLGDAFAFIDPFTGSGIYLALRGGELAADVVHRAFTEGRRAPEEITRNYLTEYRSMFGLRFKASTALRGFAFQPKLRNFAAHVLTHHPSILKLMAQSTRR